MKKITILFLSMFAFGYAGAQNLASTVPANKNAIIEEFTGVRCPNCPPGHVIVANMQAANPGRVFVVGYHPTNSSYTTPRNGTDPDFRRGYLDAFYSSSYIGSRFMPGAMINRKTFGSERMVSRGSWDANAQSVMTESSPMNVGLASSYNSSTGIVTVDVETYFTADVTDQLALYVHIMEDGLVADQSGSGGSPTYVHKHIFREALTGQWGDNITSSTNTGDLFQTQLTFDEANAIDPIDMSNAYVIAFIYNTTSGEVVTGYAVEAAAGSTVGIQELAAGLQAMKVYPNPVNDQLFFEVNAQGAATVTATLTDMVGKQVHSQSFDMGQGTNQKMIDISGLDLNDGVYFLQLNDGTSKVTRKFIKN